jgi:hypothetical protein
MIFPMIAFYGGRTLSARIRRLRQALLICPPKRMPVMTSMERKMIFFIADFGLGISE